MPTTECLQPGNSDASLGTGRGPAENPRVGFGSSYTVRDLSIPNYNVEPRLGKSLRRIGKRKSKRIGQTGYFAACEIISAINSRGASG